MVQKYYYRLGNKVMLLVYSKYVLNMINALKYLFILVLSND